MTCPAWIGSGWVAGCPEQLYTLSWICCDNDGAAGGLQPGGFKIGLFQDTIRPGLHEDTLDIEGRELKDTSSEMQFEIDRLLAGLELLEMEMELLKLQADMDMNKFQIGRSLQLQLEENLRLLGIVKRRRVQEEEIIALIVCDD